MAISRVSLGHLTPGESMWGFLGATPSLWREFGALSAQLRHIRALLEIGTRDRDHRESRAGSVSALSSLPPAEPRGRQGLEACSHEPRVELQVEPRVAQRATPDAGLVSELNGRWIRVPGSEQAPCSHGRLPRAPGLPGSWVRATRWCPVPPHARQRVPRQEPVYGRPGRAQRLQSTSAGSPHVPGLPRFAGGVLQGARWGYGHWPPQWARRVDLPRRWRQPHRHL